VITISYLQLFLAFLIATALWDLGKRTASALIARRRRSPWPPPASFSWAAPDPSTRVA
jgi:hypothetical protein